jgi:hypothetical protein
MLEKNTPVYYINYKSSSIDSREIKRPHYRMPSRKQRGAGTTGAPLSYLDPSYKEPSASAGSNVLNAEVGLVRPSLNVTGGGYRRKRRSTRNRKRSTRKRSTYKKRSTRNRKGGFYPSVMGSFVGNASRLVPAVAVTGYRMLKNYKKTRKNRK